jgi:hypothetical protein
MSKEELTSIERTTANTGYNLAKKYIKLLADSKTDWNSPEWEHGMILVNSSMNLLLELNDPRYEELNKMREELLAREPKKGILRLVKND